MEPEEDVSGLQKIGVEETETRDYAPGTLKRIRREWPEYGDPGSADRGVTLAPLPARLIDKGRAEPAGAGRHFCITTIMFRTLDICGVYFSGYLHGYESLLAFNTRSNAARFARTCSAEVSSSRCSSALSSTSIIS